MTPLDVPGQRGPGNAYPLLDLPEPPPELPLPFPLFPGPELEVRLVATTVVGVEVVVEADVDEVDDVVVEAGRSSPTSAAVAAEERSGRANGVVALTTDATTCWAASGSTPVAPAAVMLAAATPTPRATLAARLPSAVLTSILFLPGCGAGGRTLACAMTATSPGRGSGAGPEAT